MAEHKAVPRADWLSHTLNGAPWADFEWLSQLLYYGVYSAAGLMGLWVLKFALFSLCAALLWKILGRYTQEAAHKTAGVWAFAAAISPGNDIRPENFSVLFFLLLFYVLEGRRLGKRAVKNYPLWSAGLFALWANLHGGFVFGLGLLGLYGAADFFRHRKTDLPAALAAGASAVLLNPFGIQVYSVAAAHAQQAGGLGAYLKEWQEASVLSYWLWPFWGLVFTAFFAVLRRQLKTRDVPVEHWAALCALGLYAELHVRAVVYFAAVAVPVAAASLSLGGKFKRLWAWGAAAVTAVFMGALIFTELRSPRAVSQRFIAPGAVGFLDRHRGVLGGLKLFNPWHWGGYFGFRLHPDYPVFFDGRYLFHHMLPAAYAAAESPEAHEKFLSRHGVGLAAVEWTPQFSQMKAYGKKGEFVLSRPFYVFFFPKQEWALVYWDAKALVFVRRSAAPAQWLREHEYTVFRLRDYEAADRLIKEGVVEKSLLLSEIDRYGAEIDAETASRARRWAQSL